MVPAQTIWYSMAQKAHNDSSIHRHTFIDADVKQLPRCAQRSNNKPELCDFIEGRDSEAAWH